MTKHILTVLILTAPFTFGCEEPPRPRCKPSAALMSGCTGKTDVQCSEGAVVTIEKRDGIEGLPAAIYAVCNCPESPPALAPRDMTVAKDMSVPRDLSSPLKAVVR
jgi:hypothetical protein